MCYYTIRPFLGGAAMAQPILTLQELSKYYVNGRNVVAGLNRVSLSFEQGEFVAITGESGSGKSTLAHILGGILPYEDGELYIEGKPTSHFDGSDWERYRAESVGFISQSYGILPGATVLENVVSALRLTGMEKDQALSEAEKILEEVELLPMKGRRAAKLSSGQKQRLSIARALAKPSKVLIADEPTGNLDPENSDKVIQLLARTAQDRLVILITHDFDECRDYVTRHISLQDGKLIADARLRTAPEVAESAPRKRSAKDLSLPIAWLQTKSRPMWAAVVLLFLTLTAFAVFAFLGSFIVALDDTSTRIYDSNAFLNGASDRIVAVRGDLANMTQEDYDKILSIKYVEQIEKFGYIADIYCAWEKDRDFVVNSVQNNMGSRRHPEYVYTEVIEITTTDRFMQTVPLFADDSDFLTAGRLPQQYDEIVAVGGEDLLGQTICVYLQDDVTWSTGYLQVDATVVGVTQHGEGLYFHDELAQAITASYLGSEYTYVPMYQEVPSALVYENLRDTWNIYRYGPNCPPFRMDSRPATGSTMELLGNDEAYISFATYLEQLLIYPTADYNALYKSGLNTTAGEFRIAGVHKSTLENTLGVSPDTFHRIMQEQGVQNGNQVSITISDYAYTDRVLKALEEAGYTALSPYVLGSAQIDEDLAAQRSQTLYICIGALIAILVLQMIVLRALFHMETESFRILSDMGLTCRTAQRSVFWQMLLFALAGQIVGIVGILLCANSGVAQIANVTKYLYGVWWVVISLIHLLSTAVAAWIIAGGIKKRVYPRTASYVDLVIDEEEVPA